MNTYYRFIVTFTDGSNDDTMYSSSNVSATDAMAVLLLRLANTNHSVKSITLVS